MESATRIHITHKSVYFTRKSVESIIAANKRRASWIETHAGLGLAVGARNRRDHRRRHFRAHRHGRRQCRGAGGDGFVPSVGNRLRLCRFVLRRTRLADSRVGQHLHLYLRDARRDFRLDHRLGSGARIWRRRRDGRRRLVRLFQQGSARLRRQPPARTDARPFRRDGARRRDGAVTGCSICPPPASS